MLVKINEDMALDMLMKRVEYWTKDDTVYYLYEKMYESYIDSGCFEGVDFDINKIVDNDYINWCKVITEEDEEYEDIKKLYDENGLTDISCEYEFNHGYSFIEAEYDGNFLVRY